jgi:large subunit ribosomal protein L18
MKNLNKNRTFRFNRRIRNQTDYKKRLNLLKSKMVRVVVRKSNNNTLVQFVKSNIAEDIIISGAKSNNLIKLGSKIHTGNLVSAYLTGYLAGKRFLVSNKKSECILDIGLNRKLYGTKIYSALKGVVDSGVVVKHSTVVFPSQERLNGEHLKSKDMAKQIEELKSKIDKEVGVKK